MFENSIYLNNYYIEDINLSLKDAFNDKSSKSHVICYKDKWTNDGLKTKRIFAFLTVKKSNVYIKTLIVKEKTFKKGPEVKLSKTDLSSCKVEGLIDEVLSKIE